ncbi:MAG: hypothetical protein IPL23_10770 [Saprospiraceae bacterium]|nr:hypothetical protein [Saprospiraceae bacterium]
MKVTTLALKPWILRLAAVSILIRYDYSNKQQNRYGFGLPGRLKDFGEKLSINGSATFSIK